MTEIKIPFTKTKIIEKNTDPNNSANQVIDLEISTNYLMSQLEPRLDILYGGLPDNTFAKLRFYFLNNAEPAVLQSLLDNSKTNFELTFTKEQINYGVGGGNSQVDNTKPEVNLYQHPDSRMLEVKFSPQFAGVIKLTTASQGPPGPEVPPPISQIRNNAIVAIKQALNSEPTLTTNDLNSEYQNWETTINHSDSESQINGLKDQVLNNIKSKRAERERERAKTATPRLFIE